MLRSMEAAKLVLLLTLVLTASTVAGEEEIAAKVYKKVNRSVVSLQNIEGGGTGILLDHTGLILTNAHVIASPLPFKCNIDLQRGRQAEKVTFTKVKVIGVHPTKDLALVRIDPSEHKGTLQVARLASKKASPGQWVCVIGNPAGGGMVLEKTITTGVLSGVNRVLEGVSYYQVDAAINPGNSGGPLYDKSGQVLGLVTLKAADVDNVGFVIPLFDLRTTGFIPLSRRKGDPEKVKLLVAQANKYYALAKKAAAERGTEHAEAKFYRTRSAYLFHLALADDPGNASLYYNVGMLLRGLDEDEAASAYLLQAVELKPWADDNADYYKELGHSLAKQKKSAEGRVAWLEGVAKFPQKSARIWDDLAVNYFNDGEDYYKAAYAASVVMHLKASRSRASTVKKLLADATAKLNEADKKKLESAVANIPKTLRSAQLKANSMKKAGKPYITATFASYVKNSGTLGEQDTDKPLTRIEGGTKLATGQSETERPKIDLAIPAGWRDLLRDVKPSSNAVQGKWKFVGKALVSPLLSHARLQLPAKLPEEYDLKLIVERKSNRMEFAIGFVRSGRQSAFLMDIGGNTGGLTAEGGGYRGKVFTNNQPATIHCMIRREGLLVSVDGKRIFFERSTDDLPSTPKQWQVNDREKLFLGSHMSKYYIHKVMLKPYVRK